MSNMKKYYAQREEALDQVLLLSQNFILKCKMKDRDIDIEHELNHYINQLYFLQIQIKGDKNKNE